MTSLCLAKRYVHTRIDAPSFALLTRVFVCLCVALQLDVIAAAAASLHASGITAPASSPSHSRDENIGRGPGSGGIGSKNGARRGSILAQTTALEAEFGDMNSDATAPFYGDGSLLPSQFTQFLRRAVDSTEHTANDEEADAGIASHSDVTMTLYPPVGSPHDLVRSEAPMHAPSRANQSVLPAATMAARTVPICAPQRRYTARRRHQGLVCGVS